MTNKETRARDVNAITLNSPRFIDNLAVAAATHKFCIAVSSHTKVTSQIIRRLAAQAINE